MLATLNLLSTTELTLNDQAGSVVIQAEVGRQGASSFTDLLRLRVDSALLRMDASGEFMPEKGSMLPPPTPVLPLPDAIRRSELMALSQPHSPTAQTELASAHPALNSLPFEASPLDPLLTNPLLVVADGIATTPDAAADEVGIELDRTVLYRANRTTVSELGKFSVLPPPSGAIAANTHSDKATVSATRGHAAGTTVATFNAKTPTLSPEIVAQAQIDARPSKEIVNTLPVSDVLRSMRSQSPATPAPVDATLASEQKSLMREPQPWTAISTLKQEFATVETSSVRLRHRVMQTSATSQSPIQSSIAVVGANARQDIVESLPMTSQKPLTPPEPILAPIKTLVSDSLWGERVSERVLVMAGSQLKTAEIRLTPAELGPLRVQVSVDDGAANVTFHAQHLVTREALEQALPRLREMLAEIGLSLGQTNVGEQSIEQGNRHQDSEKSSPRQSSDNSAGDSADDLGDQEKPQRQKLVVTNGRVDTFA